MMTKRKLLVGALLLLTVANVTGLLTMGYCRYRHACQMGGPGGPGVADIMGQPGFMHRELGLSDEQAAQWKSLREKFQTNLARLRPALQAKRVELVQLVAAPEPDRARIDAVAAEIQALQAELQKECIQHLLDEKKILNPEQQRKFLETIRARLLDSESHHGTNVGPLEGGHHGP
jgi:Spy/CpxP family protein refolding chaperone